MIRIRRSSSFSPLSLSAVAVLFLASSSVLLHHSVRPLAVAAAAAGQSECADRGERSKECGGTGGNKPTKCCGDLVCWPNETPERNSKCIEPETLAAAAAVKTLTTTAASSASVSTTTTTDEPSTTIGTTEAPRSKKNTGRTDICAGYHDRAVSCGEGNLDRPQSCCGGYKCRGGGLNTCINDGPDTAPLKERGATFQADKIKYKKMTIKGTNFASAANFGTVQISVPGGASEGDLLLMFIGGSAGSKQPSPPAGGWTQILWEGRTDLNSMVLYKWYTNDYDIYTVHDGKNTLVTLSVIGGVDTTHPVVDFRGESNTMPGKDGRAVSASVCGVKNGIVVANYMYDDPQTVYPTGNDTATIDVLATSISGQGADGMGTFAAQIGVTDYTNPIAVAGSLQKGGGNDVVTTVSLCPDGGDCDDDPCGGGQQNRQRSLRRRR